MKQDEIDALATLRTSDADRGSSNEGVLTSLLNEMDGVQELTGVTVIAATNRPEVIVLFFRKLCISVFVPNSLLNRIKRLCGLVD